MIDIKATYKLVFNLKMLQVDYNEQKKETLKHQIADKYGVPLKNIEINFIPITVSENGERISLASNIISDIQDPKFQLQLFKEYIDVNCINDIDMADIEAIDAEVNSYVDFDSYKKYKSYKFKYVKWDNYLSYGKGNYYDFTKLNGLVLLNGQPENQCGKTSFSIDLLRFALFGKSDKTPTLNDVFNKYLPEETEVMVEAGIEIDSVDYVIRRTVTRPSLKKRTDKSKCKQKVEYFKIINGNYDVIDNCEGESVQQTNNIIKDAIGCVDDYNLVISATAYTLADLLKMGQKDKSELFSRWLGLMTLEKKEEVAKNIWKDKFSKSLLSNTYNKGSLNTEIAALNDSINYNNEQLALLQDKQDKSNENLKKLDDEKTKLLLSVKQISEELKNIDISTIENNIKTKELNIARKNEEISNWVEKYNKLKDIIFDNKIYKEKQLEVEKINLQINDLNTLRGKLLAEYKNLADDNKRISNLIANGVCPTCGHPIVALEQDKFIIENNNKMNSCINEGKENNRRIEKLKNSLVTIKDEINRMEADRNSVHDKERYELNIAAARTQSQLIAKELKELYDKKKEIEDNSENIRENNELEIKIRNVGVKIATEKNVRENIIRDIEAKKNENNMFSKNVEEKKELIMKMEKEEKLIRNWKLYSLMVGRDGITKMVLRKALPIINNEIKRLLNGLCDFDVVLHISDDNRVCIDMKRDGQIMDLGTCASGFETTMASIALRAALCSISSISRPNFCTMDEIIGPIGVSNYDNLHELLNRMCSNYQFILHISHVEDVWDWHNTQITIYKDGNISKIK